MPDENGAPLPPLPDEVYDGHKEEAAIPRDKPLPKTCEHKDVKVISATELKCNNCPAGYTGANIMELYKLLTQQS